MNETNLKAPIIDEMIYSFKKSPRIIKLKYQKKIFELFELVKTIESQGEDELRRFWIKVERGSIEDFGTYEEFLEYGEIETRDDFLDLWKFYYPDRRKWYLITLMTHGGQYFIGIDSDIILEITDIELHSHSPEDPSKLIECLKDEVIYLIRSLEFDHDDYNSMIEKELPRSKRYGKILRSDYWKIFPECKDILRGHLTQDDLKDLESIVEISKRRVPESLMEKITAGDFFEYCKMGYKANDYLKNIKKKMELKDIYRYFADGRDCGLCDIDPDSEEEFLDWYLHKSHCGGHPWEISRGGNTTHISMYVCQEGNGWFLRLAGSSRVRVQETVRMALALFRNNIPVIVHDVDQIKRMIHGEDFIGIVPDFVYPKYCGSSFPKEDGICDFMNLDHENTENIIEKVCWYPIEPIRLKK